MLSVPLQAAEKVIQIWLIDNTGAGETVGKVKASSSPHGTVFTPDLRGLSPGLHGFHVHETPSCGPGTKGGKKVAGMDAGGHYDSSRAGRHEGPYGNGHLGDC